MLQVRKDEPGRLQGVDIGEGGARVGHERFGGVGQGVETGRSGQLWSQGGRHFGIGERHIRDHRFADDGHLVAFFGVGDDGELGDVRGGAGGRGQKNERRAGQGDAVNPAGPIRPRRLRDR